MLIFNSQTIRPVASLLSMVLILVLFLGSLVSHGQVFAQSSDTPIDPAPSSIEDGALMGTSTEVSPAVVPTSTTTPQPRPAPRCAEGENLLSNHSFETPVADAESAEGGFWEMFTAVAGWVVPESGLELWRSMFGGASHGDQNAELDGTVSTQIEQTILTTPGATYEVVFDFSPRPGRDTTDNRVVALVNGIEIATAQADGTSLATLSWQTVRATFVATGTQTVVAFADTGVSNSYGSLIDNTAVCFLEPPKLPVNTCVVPGSASRERGFTLSRPSGEPTLQTILASSGFATIHAINDQIDTTQWNFEDEHTATVDITFTVVAKHARNHQAFGYYSTGSSTSFVPLFKVGAHTASVPALLPGQSITVSIPRAAARGIGFALSTQGSPSTTWFSEPSLNLGGEDNLAVYNPAINTYVLAFEDRRIATGDNDHNDLVVAISDVGCTEAEVTLVIDKIVCNSEADLPNFATGEVPPLIDGNTARTWLTDRGESCDLASDWQFQWAPGAQENAGDARTGPAPKPWRLSSDTNTQGRVVTSIPLRELDGAEVLSVREVLKEGFVPFSYLASTSTNSTLFSAELYCAGDGRNFDNVEWITDIAPGGTYHCVAWNAPQPPEPLAQCTLDIVSDTDTVIKETNQEAVFTYDRHERWTAMIPGARWIWGTEQVTLPTTEQRYTFVETFTVQNPTMSSLTVAYDNWLTITVNGMVVATRTDNGFEDFQKKNFSLTPYVISGDNRIEFEVTNLPLPDSTYRSNPAGVLYKLTVIGDPESCERTTRPTVAPSTAAPVSGVLWHDRDGDLIRDDGEEHLSGWTVEVVVGTTTRTVLTTASGTYAVTVPIGTSSVRAVPPADWVPTGTVLNGTTSSSSVCAISVATSSAAQVCDLGVAEEELPLPLERTIVVCTYDQNGTPLPRWPVTVASRSSEILRTLRTNEDGCVSTIVTAGEGTWVVSQDEQEGWTFRSHRSVGGEARLDDGAPVCRFSIPPSSPVDAEFRCEFTNAVSVSEPPVVNPPAGEERRGGGGGTLIRRVAPPAGIVAGIATTTAPRLCPFLRDHMQAAWNNDRFEVTKLQLFLSMFVATTSVTGVFNEETAAHVKLFQERYRAEVLDPWYQRGIVPHNRPTGFVYKTTRWKINDIICPGYEPYPSFEGETLINNIVIR
jgi:hypothetical protein